MPREPDSRCRTPGSPAVVLAGHSCHRVACPATACVHARLRMRLRLHPGRGHATLFELWLRWGRLAALAPLGAGAAVDDVLGSGCGMPSAHSILLGRAHFRHALRVPVEEHVLIMAPPRTGKSGLLASVILHYPGPVLEHHHQGRRLPVDERHPFAGRADRRLQPAGHRRGAEHLPLESAGRLQRPGGGHPPGRQLRQGRLDGRGRGLQLLESARHPTTCGRSSTRPRWPRRICAPLAAGCSVASPMCRSTFCGLPAPISGH